MSSNIPIRVLIAKVGLDGHERGARAVSFGLRDQGMEVIYTGIRQNIDSIIQTALQEDIDVLGLSSLAGAHDLLPEIIKKLKEKGRDDILVIAGGVIPDEDIPILKENGVSAVFQPGSRIKDIADYIKNNVRKGADK
jgi:methylmalonyl-CoA mutase C-terminal domain/subunit